MALARDQKRELSLSEKEEIERTKAVIKIAGGKLAYVSQNEATERVILYVDELF
jgi:hypothetical protein